MAEKRKLLAEIEKCFKKIDEGVELFEDTMMKMHDANSDNQRDKYQDDLKKEIKKLQRLRDQVKGWQNSSDIKDKDKLNHYRKVIEQRMEQFKDIERENKTKPHSKQGLCAEEKLDPKEKEKADTIEWLQNQIRELGVEADRTEMKVESLNNTDSGKRRGKKDDGKKGEKEKNMEKLKHHLDKMAFHISKLEICMRMVNNESLEASLVMSVLKDTMEMYIEALDPDYDGTEEELENLDPTDTYEELNLGQLCAQLGTVNIGSIDEERAENGKATSDNHEDDSRGSRHGSTDVPHTPSSPAPKRAVSSIIIPPAPTPKLIKENSSESVPVVLSGATPATPPPPPPGIPYNSVAAGRVVTAATPPAQITTNSGKASFSVPAVARHPSSQSKLVDPIVLPSSSAIVSNANDENKNPVLDVRSVSNQAPPVLLMKTKTVAEIVAGTATNTSVVPKLSAIALSDSLKNTHKNILPLVDGVSLLESCCPETGETFGFCDLALATHGEAEKVRIPSKVAVGSSNGTAMLSSPVIAEKMNGGETSSPTDSSVHKAMPLLDNALRSASVPTDMLMNEETLQMLRQSIQQPVNTDPQKANIPAWLGASPLGKAPMTQEFDQQLNILESCFNKSNLPLDSERPRTYLPKIKYPASPNYPQTTPRNGDTLEYYLKLSPETLFFVFYYMEGTKAQLLAAKALKKLSWRFHTKYLTWFQRHEEPKQITDDFEQGTYVYFDFEKWSQRKKEAFTFEYRYLEDKEFD